MNPSILKNKLKAPSSTHLMDRPRLIEKVRKSDSVRLFVIRADAGYGKTTLMTQLQKEFNGYPVWYQLDRGDHDLSVFISHLTEGVRWHCPDFGDWVIERLKISTDIRREINQVLTVFVNELSEKVDLPVSFYLDDFHLVNDSKAILDAVHFLIQHLPEESRLYIASREKPSLSLGRLRTQRSIMEIDSSDLRFSIEETTGLLNSRCVNPLRPDEILAWHTHTEGWPVALVISQNIIDAEGGVPRDFKETRGITKAIDDYLTEEVWDSLDSRMRDFLTKSSLTETVEPSICDSVFCKDESVNAASILTEAENRNIMITSLDQASLSYRYHPLFREFLQEKLNQTCTKTEIAGLHRGFGEAYEKQGGQDQAIEHYLCAGFEDGAADLIEAYAEYTLEAGRLETLERWLNRIPEEIREGRPWLRLYMARVMNRKCELAEAGQEYLEARKGFKAKRDRKGLLQCAQQQSMLYLLVGKNEESLAAVREAMKLATNSSEKAIAYDTAVSQRARIGDMDGAKKLQDEALKLCDRTEIEANTILELCSINMDYITGDFRNALRKLENIDPNSGMQAEYHARLINNIAVTLYLTGDYEQAHAVSVNALSIAKGLGEHRNYWEQYEAMAQIQIGLGNIEEGRKMALRFTSYCESSGMIDLCEYNHLGTCDRRRNALRAALKAHKHSLKLQKDESSPYGIAMSLANIGADKIRIFKGHGIEGVAELDEAQEIAGKHGFRYVEAQIYFHRAWRDLACGKNNEALNAISHSLGLASRLGHNHFMIQEGKRSLELLAFAFENGVELEYLTYVFKNIGRPALKFLTPILKSESPLIRKTALVAVSSVGGAAAYSHIQRMLHDEDADVRRVAKEEDAALGTRINSFEDLLSRRESEILPLLAEGLSNAEIAERLYITEQTVKSHVTRIFRKLGIKKRVQAAMFFHELRNGSDGQSGMKMQEGKRTVETMSDFSAS
jgi:ATP/maltotriose-dependent transcriptional regulator MalT